MKKRCRRVWVTGNSFGRGFGRVCARNAMRCGWNWMGQRARRKTAGGRHTGTQGSGLDAALPHHACAQSLPIPPFHPTLASSMQAALLSWPLLLSTQPCGRCSWAELQCEDGCVGSSSPYHPVSALSDRRRQRPSSPWFPWTPIFRSPCPRSDVAESSMAPGRRSLLLLDIPFVGVNADRKSVV